MAKLQRRRDGDQETQQVEQTKYRDHRERNAEESRKKAGHKKTGRKKEDNKKSDPVEQQALLWPGAFEFLAELTDNNNKEWFAENKHRYESEIREPALEIVRAMAPGLKRVSKRFVADDRKVGGALMRIHRDVRFSPDKTPYKTNVGLHFRHERAKDVHAPGFYLHLALDGCFIGVGIWKPEASALAAIRERISEDSKTWVACRKSKAFRDQFELAGDSLKRMPRGYDPDHPFADDLRRKDHLAMQELESGDLMDPDLVARLGTAFATAGPYMRFLTEAMGAEF